MVAGLVRASFLVNAVYAESAREYGLTVQQGQLLCVLMGRPYGMGDLGATLGLEKSSLTGLVDRAVRRGLVRREPDPDDRRAVHVVLTDRRPRTGGGLLRGDVPARRRAGGRPGRPRTGTGWRRCWAGSSARTKSRPCSSTPCRAERSDAGETRSAPSAVAVVKRLTQRSSVIAPPRRTRLRLLRGRSGRRCGDNRRQRRQFGVARVSADHPQQGTALLAHSGMFPCFLGGSDSRLLRSSDSARATCPRVCAGTITESTYPRSAAAYGLSSVSSYSWISSARS